MITGRASVYISQMQINSNIILRQLDGLSNTDSLLQPEARGNCANWVLGHIIATRKGMYDALEQDFVWDEETTKLYGRQSLAITGADSPHLPLEDLLQVHQTTSDFLVECFNNLSDSQLDSAVNEKGTTVADRLTFLIWHESYHVGQLEYLRQLAGVDDVVLK